MKNKLFDEINEQFKIMSSQSVLRSQLISHKLNINSVDLESIEILMRSGRSTAGELAKLTGLTTGAVTGLIDRLVKAGYASRELDGNDRRKIFVKINDETVSGNIDPLYLTLTQSLEALFHAYTDDELNLITGFLKKVNAVSENDMEKLK